MASKHMPTIALVIASFALAPAASAQSTMDAMPRADFKKDPRLDLSAAREKMVHQELASVPTQSAPENMPMIVGAMVPQSMQLRNLPDQITQRVETIKPYDYVKLKDAKILLVDPTNRVVQSIITPEEATTGRSKN